MPQIKNNFPELAGWLQDVADYAGAMNLALNDGGFHGDWCAEDRVAIEASAKQFCAAIKAMKDRQRQLIRSIIMDRPKTYTHRSGTGLTRSDVGSWNDK